MRSMKYQHEFTYCIVTSYAYRFLVKRNNSDIPQWGITQNIGKQHYLSFSDKLKLERFFDLVAADHVEERGGFVLLPSFHSTGHILASKDDEIA